MSKNKPTGKTYEIDSLEQLINVTNVENFDRISMDFMIWLGHMTKLIEKLREESPERYKDATNFEILRPGFTWIDDGKTDIHFAKIKNSATGEVFTTNLKKKQPKKENGITE